VRAAGVHRRGRAPGDALSEPYLGWILLGAIGARYLWEIVVARRNARALIAAGARQWPGDFSWLLIVLHAGSFAGIVAERLAGARIGGWASIVAGAVLVLATMGRVWVLRTLGKRWTIRVVTVPGERAVVTGPYRFVRHPNYVVVMAEMLSIPALFHAWWTLALGTIPHAVGLLLRIRKESEAWRAAT
jgi:methyltransferase